jgi:uncharacterized repeat protein (TIGR03803 family)
VLHSFGDRTDDGRGPQASLIYVNGAFYGTTADGGERTMAGRSCKAEGCGTVYRISRSGVEHAIYRFRLRPDAAHPVGGLLYVKDMFYGTTDYGGSYGRGAIFQVTMLGRETVLHAFSGKPDGANPMSALTDVNGALYGTTPGGGSNNIGTIFRINP